MKKTVSLLMLCMMCMFCLGSCSGGAKDELKKMVEEADEGCPQEIAGIGEIESFEYDSKTNYVILTIEFDMPGLDFSILQGQKDELKTAFFDSFYSSGGKKMFKCMAEADAGFAVKLLDKNTGSRITFKMTPKEIKKKVKK